MSPPMLTNVTNRIAVLPFEGGATTQTFKFNPSGTVWTLLRWSADGKSILYSVNSNNVSNIWSQPLDGGPAKQITEFKDMLITGFAWSHDGKQLVCSRGTLMRDAILISDLK